jgi:uncharacterized protein (DUF779 family)
MGFLSGGICPDGFCPGAYVRGDFVLFPNNKYVLLAHLAIGHVSFYHG